VDDLELSCPPDWLDRQPLTRRDLDYEQQQLKRIGIELSLDTLEPRLNERLATQASPEALGPASSPHAGHIRRFFAARGA
jgi:hypothetical protein